MLRNSRESMWLLTPFFLWGLIVITMHALGYVSITQVCELPIRGKAAALHLARPVKRPLVQPKAECPGLSASYV